MSNEDLVNLIQSGVNKTENMTILYEQNINFIKSVVKKYSYVCKVQNFHKYTSVIEFEELLNEAYFGLVKAVENYDPSFEVLFLSYAGSWINQAVKRYIDNCGRVIRVPIHTQEKIGKYHQVTGFYLEKYDREPSTYEYAKALYMSENEIERLESFMYQSTVKSLDETIPGRDKEDNVELLDTLASDEDLENDTVEKLNYEQLQCFIWGAVDNILDNETMKEVIRLIFAESMTLKAVGEVLGLTVSEVKTNEMKALRRLRMNSKTRELLRSYLVA